jgi:hypothetical protein
MHPHDRRCYKKSQRQEIHIRESGSLVRRPARAVCRGPLTIPHFLGRLN